MTEPFKIGDVCVVNQSFHSHVVTGDLVVIADIDICPDGSVGYTCVTSCGVRVYLAHVTLGLHKSAAPPKRRIFG